MYQDENTLLKAIYDDYQLALRRIAISLKHPNKELDEDIQETVISYFCLLYTTPSPRDRR